MKKIGIGISAILAGILIVPILIVYLGGYYDSNFRIEVSQKNTEEVNQITRFEEEIISILANEIPSYYEDEVLKAQAVIIRTYLLRRQLGLVDEGSLTYLTQAEMNALWQQDYEQNYIRYRQAVMDTRDVVIYYEDELIEPLYHRANNGMTRDAQKFYGFEVPYLQITTNEYDGAHKRVTLTREEITSLLKEQYPQIIISEELLEYQIQVINKDSSNYISEVQIGNIMMTGEELRELLELPSSNFSIHVIGDEFIFDVYGIGHGIGFSQNGANELAKQGYEYKDILDYYYKDIQIKKIE